MYQVNGEVIHSEGAFSKTEVITVEGAGLGEKIGSNPRDKSAKPNRQSSCFSFSIFSGSHKLLVL